MSVEEFREELELLWLGSGFSLKSMIEHLKTVVTHGYDMSHDESMAMFYFEECRVLVYPNNYELMPKELK